MDNQTIRVGFVGAGGNTRQEHLPRFRAIEGVELVSVANRSRESSQRVADEFHIPNVYDDPFELIGADDTDAICIGTWPHMHKPLVLAALENDKHVLTEARMALNANEAGEMLEAARLTPHLVTQLVPAPLTFAVDPMVTDLIARGYLGDILSVDLTISSFLPDKAPGRFVDLDGPYTWRHDRDLSGYNVMLMGAWYECLTRWLGPASSVAAVTRINVKSRTDATGNRRTVTIPDHVEVLCEMYSGPIMRMRISEVTGFGLNAVWLFGSEGTLHVDPGTDAMSGARRGDDGLSKIAIPDEKRGYWRVEEEFINAIRGKEQVKLNTFEEGLRYMEFTEAVTRSAQLRTTVYLPL